MSVNVEGVDVAGPGEVAALVENQLRLGSVWGDANDAGKDAGATRAYRAARGTQLEAPFADALHELTERADPEISSEAVSVLGTFPDNVDVPRLMRPLEAGRFDGVPTSGPNADLPDLRWAVLRVIAAAAPTDPPTREFLRDAATDPHYGWWVLAAVARDDPQWVASHAAEVAKGGATAVSVALRNLSADRDRERFVRVLSNNPVTQDAVRHAIETTVVDGAEKTHLLALLG